VGGGDSAQLWPRHLQVCTEQWFGVYSLPALLCVCAHDVRAALLLLMMMILMVLRLSANAGSREPDATADAFRGGRRSGRVEAVGAAAADSDADSDADTDAGAGADAALLLGWRVATPVEVVGVPVSEGQSGSAPIVKGVPLTRGAVVGNDPPPPPPPPPERPWLLEWAAPSSSGESEANDLRRLRAQGRREGRRGGGDADGTSLRTVAQHSSLLRHRRGVTLVVSSRRAARGEAARAVPPPMVRRRRATRDAVPHDA